MGLATRTQELRLQWLKSCYEELEGNYVEASYGAISYLVPEWVTCHNVDIRLYAVAEFNAANPANVTYTLPKDESTRSDI